MIMKTYYMYQVQTRGNDSPFWISLYHNGSLVYPLEDAKKALRMAKSETCERRLIGFVAEIVDFNDEVLND